MYTPGRTRPGPPPAPDFPPQQTTPAERVQFALRGEVDFESHAVYLQGRRRVGFLQAGFWFAILAFAFEFARRLGLPVLPSACACAGAWVSVYAFGSVRTLPWVPSWLLSRRYRDRLPPRASGKSRLACVGAPDRVEDLGPLSDQFFEPRVFNVSLAMPPAVRARRNTCWGVGVMTGSVIVGIVWMFRGSMTPGGLFIGAMPAIFVAEFVVAALWPAYLRIVPGRVDVLRGRPFSSRLRTTRSFDLRDAHLTVDLVYFMVQADGRAGTLEFSMHLVRRPTELAHALFLAALSTHEPAPLPRYALLG